MHHPSSRGTVALRRLARPAPATFAVLAVLATLAGTPLSAQAMREITGSLTYPQRIALPEDARVTLRVTDTGGAEVMRDDFPTNGRQVPIAFAFGAPTGGLTLEAGIAIDGAPGWQAAPVAIPAGEAALSLGPIEMRPLPATHVWTCGDQVLRVQFSGEMAALETGAGRVELRQTIAASGARYEAPDDPGTWIWNKGNDLTASLNGRALAPCVPSPTTAEAGAVPDAVPGAAPEAAADAGLIARGNEPGWRADLIGDTVRLRLQDGTDESFPRPEPEPVPGGQRHTLAEGTVLTLTDGLCRDTMTGLPYPAGASLTRAGQQMAGCAGDPMALLEGPAWRVERIDGEEPVAQSQVTIAFEGSQAAGSGGCNRWFAEARLSGEGLSFGPAGATMMACPDPIMAQERRFLAALERVDGFDIAADGALHLTAGGIPVLVARR